MKRRGFTLIELLVVVAIIAVLIGILMPALTNARATSQSTKCLAALHDIGVAMTGYFNVNDDRFPLLREHGGSAPGTAWLDTLAPHTDMKLQYRCPTDQATNFDDPDPTLRRVTSYGMNSFMTPLQVDWTPASPFPPHGFVVQTRLGDTSHWVYSAELAEWGTDDSGNVIPVHGDDFHSDRWLINPLTGYGGDQPSQWLALGRHLQKENYLFADGHAEHVGFDQLYHVSADGQTLEIDRFDPGFPRSPQGWYQSMGNSP